MLALGALLVRRDEGTIEEHEQHQLDELEVARLLDIFEYEMPWHLGPTTDEEFRRRLAYGPGKAV